MIKIQARDISFHGIRDVNTNSSAMEKKKSKKRKSQKITVPARKQLKKITQARGSKLWIKEYRCT